MNFRPTIKLGVEGVGNYFLTGMAAKSASMRIPIFKVEAGQEPSVYNDARFAATLLGVAGSIWGKGMIGEAGEVLAGGAGHSLIATEAMRASLTSMQAQPAPAQVGYAPPPAQVGYAPQADQGGGYVFAADPSAYAWR